MKNLPQGCDQQGRYPEAAEAATEIGADDPPEHDMTTVVMTDFAIAVTVLVVVYAIVVGVMYG